MRVAWHWGPPAWVTLARLPGRKNSGLNLPPFRRRWGLQFPPPQRARQTTASCSRRSPPTTMMGGGVQDVVDNYVAGALLSVEAALDDEMNRMQNLNVCSRRHTCPHTRIVLLRVRVPNLCLLYVPHRRTIYKRFGPTECRRCRRRLRSGRRAAASPALTPDAEAEARWSWLGLGLGLARAAAPRRKLALAAPTHPSRVQQWAGLP